jgi:hypothetical protein
VSKQIGLLSFPIPTKTKIILLLPIFIFWHFKLLFGKKKKSFTAKTIWKPRTKTISKEINCLPYYSFYTSSDNKYLLSPWCESYSEFFLVHFLTLWWKQKNKGHLDVGKQYLNIYYA